MDFDKLTAGERIVVIAGGLLLVDLVFLPWYDFLRLSRTGIQTPNSFWGVMALVVTAAMVALVLVTRFTSAEVPELPVPRGQAMFLGGVTAYGGSLVRKESEGAPPPRGSPGL